MWNHQVKYLPKFMSDSRLALTNTQQEPRLLRTRRSLMWGEAEGPGTIEPAEKKARGESHQCVQTPDGREREGGARLWSGVSSDRTRGSEQKLKYRNFGLNIKKPVFYCKGDGRLDQVAQGGCVHPCRYSKPNWTGPWATCSRWRSSEQGVGLGHHQRCLPTSAEWG